MTNRIRRVLMIRPKRSQKAAEGRKSKAENNIFVNICPIGFGSTHPNLRLAARKGILKLFFFFNTIHVNSLAYHIIGCYPINSRNTLLLSYYFQKCFGYRNFHFRSFPLKIPKLKDSSTKILFSKTESEATRLLPKYGDV